MKKISKKECYSRIVCIKCGKPLSTECKSVGRIGIGQKRYHWECSLAVQDARRNNISPLRKRLGEKATCIICGKHKADSQLNKQGMCAACAKLVEKRENYNTELKKSIDWDYEKKLEKERQKKRPRRTYPSDLRRQAEIRSPYIHPVDDVEENDGSKPYRKYNNPAAYKLDRDKTGRYAADPVTRTYDTVTAEGVAVRVECRGQVHPYIFSHK